MALQLGALREALIDAGADPAKATRAAEEAATHEGRFAAIETRLAVLTWMSGANAALTMLLIGVAFAVWSKLGEVGGLVAQLVRSLPP